jgi:peptide/nickel transport system permease protein
VLVFIIRRSLQSVVVLLAMSVIVFVGVYAIGNPIDILINPQADQIDRERAIAGARARQAAVGAVRRVPARRAERRPRPLVRALDLGAQADPREDAGDARARLAAMLIAIVLGIPLGLWAGLRPHAFSGRAIMAGSILGFSLPTFWVGPHADHGVLGHAGLAAEQRPRQHRRRARRAAVVPDVDGLRHLVMPATNLALFNLALLIRLTRSGAHEALLQDYVKFARAKGLSNRRVIGVHVLRNILIPVVTVIGLQFGSLIAFAIVTESVFAWPGMGKLLIDSINLLDRPVIVAYLLGDRDVLHRHQPGGRHPVFVARPARSPDGSEGLTWRACRPGPPRPRTRRARRRRRSGASSRTSSRTRSRRSGSAFCASSCSSRSSRRSSRRRIPTTSRRST